MAWPLEERCRGRGLDDVTEHDRDAIADVAHDPEVVGDEEISEAAFLQRGYTRPWRTWIRSAARFDEDLPGRLPSGLQCRSTVHMIGRGGIRPVEIR
jgi:hypothetical protein